MEETLRSRKKLKIWGVLNSRSKSGEISGVIELQKLRGTRLYILYMDSEKRLTKDIIYDIIIITNIKDE